MATSTVIGNVVTAVKNNIAAIKTAIGEATSTTSGLMSAKQASKLDGIANGANKTTVDSAMSSTSTNPVQNKVVNSAISSLNASLAKIYTAKNESWVNNHDGWYIYENGSSPEVPYPYVIVLRVFNESGNRGILLAIRWANIGSYSTSTTMWTRAYHDTGWTDWAALN